MDQIDQSENDPSENFGPIYKDHEDHLSPRFICYRRRCRRIGLEWYPQDAGNGWYWRRRYGYRLLRLNYLAMASDIGKLFGWCSGVLLLYFPTWVVLFMASFLGLFGYGLQWLVIQKQITLPYIMVFVLSLSAGGSIPWFNTVCFVLNIKNFPENWPLAVSLSVSFNGVTAALYNLIVTKLSPNDKTTSYLVLNAFVPFITSIASLGPILQQSTSQQDNNQKDEIALKDDAHIFIFLYILAAVTGLYLFFTNPVSQNIVIVTMLLIVLPFIMPKVIYLIKRAHRAFYPDGPIERPDYELVEMNHLEEFHEECSTPVLNKSCCSVFDRMIKIDRLRELGEEHSATYMMSRCDFWLYYVTYFCGGTIGLVYSNNLGQIVESLGYISETKALVTIYSTCSFFGRLLSAAMDMFGCFYQQPTITADMYATRTGRLTLGLVAMPVAFLLLILSGAKLVLSVATGLIGICSGFLISTAVSITSELFGSKSSGINHNILITNIPLGSLLYGVLAALIYVDNIDNARDKDLDDGMKVCIGRDCYHETFMLWGLISIIGVSSSFLLFLRTKPAYESHYKRKIGVLEETICYP
ncbi:unnamed protein product [Lactuca saligna]|uniref:Nodulin-like domain-containing protein n=1 Tax=Lactuca saligna TaxID=75948 RepID=A0AA35ZI33_LACSI|nr:unnamed protein product [Lactuca saligna]